MLPSIRYNSKGCQFLLNWNARLLSFGVHIFSNQVNGNFGVLSQTMKKNLKHQNTTQVFIVEFFFCDELLVS